MRFSRRAIIAANTWVIAGGILTVCMAGNELPVDMDAKPPATSPAAQRPVVSDTGKCLSVDTYNRAAAEWIPHTVIVQDFWDANAPVERVRFDAYLAMEDAWLLGVCKSRKAASDVAVTMDR
jgi:hypothetical protein